MLVWRYDIDIAFLGHCTRYFRPRVGRYWDSHTSYRSEIITVDMTLGTISAILACSSRYCCRGDIITAQRDISYRSWNQDEDQTALLAENDRCERNISRNILSSILARQDIESHTYRWYYSLVGKSRSRDTARCDEAIWYRTKYYVSKVSHIHSCERDSVRRDKPY